MIARLAAWRTLLTAVSSRAIDGGSGQRRGENTEREERKKTFHDHNSLLLNSELGEYGREIAHIKREYYRICRDLLDRYKKEKGIEFDSRTAVLSLFGMMNWIYTWYNPRLDGGAGQLSREMGNIFFRGISAGKRNGAGK